MKPAQAAFAAALFLVLDYARMLNGTHHWFSVLAVMGALAILLKARTPSRIAIAGALLGVATFFTQTRGPMAALGIGAYLIWDQFQTKDSWSAGFKRLLLLILPLIATWGALSSYFIAKVGPWQLWYFQVIYVLRYVIGGPTHPSYCLAGGSCLVKHTGQYSLLAGQPHGSNRLRVLVVEVQDPRPREGHRDEPHHAAGIGRRGDVRRGSPESEFDQALLRRNAGHYPVRLAISRRSNSHISKLRNRL